MWITLPKHCLTAASRMVLRKSTLVKRGQEMFVDTYRFGILDNVAKIVLSLY